MADAATSVLCHVALEPDWTTAREAGTYRVSTRGASLDEVGFVHLSYPRQVRGVVERFYADAGEVLLLVIERTRLTVPVVDEPVGPEGEHFPHLYGPLDLEAVVEVVRLPIGDGGVDLPPWLDPPS